MQAEQLEPKRLISKFSDQAERIGVQSRSEIEFDHWGAPHVPKALPRGYGAVYVFALSNDYGSRCEAGAHRVLKVGKAGPNSNARFQSQHYGFSARSTVAGALIANPIIWSHLGIETLRKADCRDWLLENTERYNFYVPEFSQRALDPLENFLRAVLGPALEGLSTRSAKDEN